jgi:hypothetical protein
VSYRSVAMRGLGERVATGDNAAIPMVGPWETAPRAPQGRRPAPRFFLQESILKYS